MIWWQRASLQAVARGAPWPKAIRRTLPTRTPSRIGKPRWQKNPRQGVHSIQCISFYDCLNIYRYMLYVCVTDLCMCVYQLYMAIILFSFSSLQPFRMVFGSNDGPDTQCAWSKACCLESIRTSQYHPLSSNILLFWAFRPWLVCQSLDSALAHIELEDHVQLDFRNMFLLCFHIRQKERHVESFILRFMMLDLLRNIRKQRRYIDLEICGSYVTTPLRSALRSQFPERLGSLPSRHSSLFKESAIHQPGGGCDWDV